MFERQVDPSVDDEMSCGRCWARFESCCEVRWRGEQWVPEVGLGRELWVEEGWVNEVNGCAWRRGRVKGWEGKDVEERMVVVVDEPKVVDEEGDELFEDV